MIYNIVVMKKNPSFYTTTELKHIFRIENDRTIASCFGDKIQVLENGTEGIYSKHLIEYTGFLPTEPFMTRNEVTDELGITFAQFSALVKNKYLPYFRFRN